MTEHTVQSFVALETRVWEAQVRGDAEAERELLPADFLGVDQDGPTDLTGHLAQLDDGPITATFRLSGARLTEVSADAVLLTYRADSRRPGGTVQETVYISSLWVRRDGRWWNTFSQDTPGARSPGTEEPVDRIVES